MVDVKVKICGITNAADGKAAVNARADMIGLNFVPSSLRYVTVEAAQEIAAQLPEFILRVGVFADPEPETVFVAMRRCGLNLLQFHGNESPEFCRQFGIMTMKAFRMRDASTLNEIAKYDVDAILLDSYVLGVAGGTGETFNWDLAVQAKQFGRPIFLAGGLNPENVANAVRVVRPFGVDVASGVEESPGKKDEKKVRAFVEAVRTA